MRRIWLVAAIFGVSIFAIGAAADPKVINAQLHIEPAGAGLSATVEPISAFKWTALAGI